MAGGKSGALSWGDQLFGRPDIVWRGLCEEITSVGGFRPFNGYEIAKLGLPCYGVGVWDSEFVGSAGAFWEFLPEGGQEWGPPSFRLWGGASVACAGFDRCCQCGKGGGEPLVKLVGRGSIGGART